MKLGRFVSAPNVGMNGKATKQMDEELLRKFREIDPMCDFEQTEASENGVSYWVIYTSIKVED